MSPTLTASQQPLSKPSGASGMWCSPWPDHSRLSGVLSRMRWGGSPDASGAMVQVWDYNRSAEMRDTEGGASKRSVLEQADKLKKYLAAESL